MCIVEYFAHAHFGLYLNTSHLCWPRVSVHSVLPINPWQSGVNRKSLASEDESIRKHIHRNILYIQKISPYIFAYFNIQFFFLCVLQVLFRFAVAFFKYVEEDIMRKKNTLELNHFMRIMGEKITDVQRVAQVSKHST